MKLSKHGVEDKWAWLPTDSGLYSAKSGYFESTKKPPEPHNIINLVSNFNWIANVWNI